MSIYVDKLSPCLPNKKWRWKESCHLIGDSISELHIFAEQIGLKRSWFQGGSVLPHYDLTKQKRKHAINNGAIEISDEKLKERLRNNE